MVDEATITEEVSRFGFTKAEGRAFQELYAKLSNSSPREKEIDGMPFLDWEAERLRKVFEAFKETDPGVCAVLAHMIWYVADRDYYTSRQR